jgi:hypothetical protein
VVAASPSCPNGTAVSGLSGQCLVTETYRSRSSVSRTSPHPHIGQFRGRPTRFRRSTNRQAFGETIADVVEKERRRRARPNSCQSTCLDPSQSGSGLITLLIGNSNASPTQGSPAVTSPLIAFYVCGWLATTALALVAAFGFRDRRQPPRLLSVAAVSVIAGALWPLLMIGVVDLGEIMSFAKLLRSYGLLTLVHRCVW